MGFRNMHQKMKGEFTEKLFVYQRSDICLHFSPARRWMVPSTTVVVGGWTPMEQRGRSLWLHTMKDLLHYKSNSLHL